MASILANLPACYGADCVVDVFENTGMALKARDLNIGCYVVRGVLTSAQLAAWHQALTDSVFFIANTQGPRYVDLKGDRPGPPAYRTIQATAGKCTCKYVQCTSCNISATLKLVLASIRKTPCPQHTMIICSSTCSLQRDTCVEPRAGARKLTARVI